MHITWVFLSHCFLYAVMETRAWRDEILAGLDHVLKKGPVDTLVVYGQNAEPILTGRMAHHVFIAAGQYGQGRVVVFSGREYTKEMEKEPDHPEMAKLRSNVLKWVRPGHESHNIINITDKVEVDLGDGQNQVLLWQIEHPRKNKKFVKDVGDFIRNGGGAIFTKTPSGYEWRHGHLSKSPVFDILHEVGIYFSLPRAGLQDRKMIAENEAHLSHLGRAVEESLRDPKNVTIYGKVLGFGVDNLPNKDEVKNKLRRLLNEVDKLDIHYIPRGTKKRVKTPEGINLAHFVHYFLWDPESGKAPGSEEFPGDFDTPPQLVCLDMTVESKKRKVHPLGAYLPPGGTVRVEVVDGDVRGWEVRVGAHSDQLDKHTNIKRWLRVMHLENLKKPVTEVFNPFGGLVYLVSPKRPSLVHVRISNAVESPLYDITKDDSQDSWDEIRQRPGLWADLKGQHIHITIPSSSIREFEEIKPAIEFWDTVIRHFHDLRGTKVDHTRGEWIVPDMQPSAGAMHSGYPIVTHLDITEPDGKNFILKPVHGTHWGLFHELGHNMQMGVWTPANHGEVTCNIFSMYGMYKMYGIGPWQSTWVERAKSVMKDSLQKEKPDVKPGVDLGIYAQLARDFGFDAYKKVFRSYKKDKNKPQRSQDKVDVWVEKFSRVVGYNLCPAYELWDKPISEKVGQALQNLTPYLPDDEVTQVVPEKVRRLSEKYPGLVRHPEKYSEAEGSCAADAESDDADEDSEHGDISEDDHCSD